MQKWAMSSPTTIRKSPLNSEQEFANKWIDTGTYPWRCSPNWLFAILDLFVLMLFCFGWEFFVDKDKRQKGFPKLVIPKCDLYYNMYALYHVNVHLMYNEALSKKNDIEFHVKHEY
jgi:hypothetical protein